jgi:hypothetical protein
LALSPSVSPSVLLQAFSKYPISAKQTSGSTTYQLKSTLEKPKTKSNLPKSPVSKLSVDRSSPSFYAPKYPVDKMSMDNSSSSSLAQTVLSSISSSWDAWVGDGDTVMKSENDYHSVDQGICGVFVLALEDEFEQVRSAAIGML